DEPNDSGALLQPVRRGPSPQDLRPSRPIRKARRYGLPTWLIVLRPLDQSGQHHNRHESVLTSMTHFVRNAMLLAHPLVSMTRSNSSDSAVDFATSSLRSAGKLEKA